MIGFPPELSNALQAPLLSAAPIRRKKKIDSDRLRWFERPLKASFTRSALALLDRELAPHLRVAQRKVDPESITGMQENYSESLSKSLRNHSAMLNDRRSGGFRAAERIGLVRFLQSDSLRQAAEQVSGFRLSRNPGMQAICYRAGDYVGPHNDHHPEEAHLRNGYVDLQITLCNEFVERQYLVYECNGYFNRVCETSVPSGISISMLPFWHQVTPLVAKRGKEAEARRWLLLASFLIEADK